jgi:hypothetical protein
MEKRTTMAAQNEARVDPLLFFFSLITLVLRERKVGEGGRNCDIRCRNDTSCSQLGT